MSIQAPMHESMPAGALPAGIFVLIYSFFCFACGILLAVALHRNQERFTYVHLFALTTTLQTVTSICQQIYYMARWRSSRIDSYMVAVASVRDPVLNLGPQSTGFGAATFWIQCYFFNANSLILLFWAIALTVNIWGLRCKAIRVQKALLGLLSKIIIYLAPALVVIIRATTRPRMSFGSGVFADNVLVFLSLTIGAICMILVLTKYIRTRMFMGSDNAPSSTQPRSVAGSSTTRSRLNFFKVDPWLVVRFSIAFVILSVFNVFLVLYSISRHHRTLAKGGSNAPDFSVKTTVTDVLNYMPVVTCSLLAFLLFGLTAQARSQYAIMFPCLPRAGFGSTPTASRMNGSRATEWNSISSRRQSTVGIHVAKSFAHETYHEMPATPMVPLTPTTPDKAYFKSSNVSTSTSSISGVHQNEP